MLEDAAVASLDASAVPLEDAVAPPDEPVLVLPLSQGLSCYAFSYFFTSLRFSFLLDEFIIHKGC